MTGYSIKKVLPDELILSHSKIPIFLFAITMIGIFFITLSVLTKYKIINPPETFFNLFLGMGIIFTAGSIIFMMQKIPQTISFSKINSSIIFSENGQPYSIPFASFSKMIITVKITSSDKTEFMTYQLNLVFRNGSTLLICESENKTELQQTAESIISYIDIDLLSGATLLHRGSGIYKNAQPVYPPLNAMSIKKSDIGNTEFYQWNYRKSLAMIFLLGAFIFGFNYLFFTFAYPSMSKYNAGLYAGSVILILIDVFFSITLLFNIFGSNIVEVTDSMFLYRQRIFGFSINRKSFSRDEIAMIKCGFTSDENKITIFTKRGTDIYNEMKVFAAMNDLNNKSLLLSLIPKVMELRSNIIEIDGMPLYYYEKLYLENEWSKKLKLQQYEGLL